METGSSSLLQIWSHFNGFISNKKQLITFRLLLYWTLLCTAPTVKTNKTHKHTKLFIIIKQPSTKTLSWQILVSTSHRWFCEKPDDIWICCLLSGSVLQSGPLDIEATRAKRSRTVLEERGIRSRRPGGRNTWSLIRICSDPETFTDSSRAQRWFITSGIKKWIYLPSCRQPDGSTSQTSCFRFL